METKKLRLLRRDRGFTLIEIMIVLAVLAVMAAIVVPNVAGFLGRGKERAFDADRRLLQSTVDAYRTDVGKRAGNPWPTLGALAGDPADMGNAIADTPDKDYGDVGDKDKNRETGEDLNSFIDIAELATDGYLKGADVVKSADTRLNTTATNSVSGSYGWYIDDKGVVQALYWNDKNNDDDLDTPEGEDVDATEVTTPLPSGFQDGIYP